MQDIRRLPTRQVTAEKKEEALLVPTMSAHMTPEYIVGKLFSYHNTAHFYHLQTDTIGKHLLLDELYKALVEFKDEIAEYLLGVQVPKRLDQVIIDQLLPYSDEHMLAFINEGFNFSIALCEYAEAHNEEELCNMASDLQKAFNKSRLFTTYK